MTLQQLQAKPFEHFRDWLKFWCSVYRDINHVEYDSEKKKFFYGNNSYMDLGELLRQNSNFDSSPCIIYDTDIHLQRTANDRVLMKQHSFYICVLADSQIDGEEVKRAKDRCELLALKLMAWFDACKIANPKMRGYQLGGADSTTSFLNGWEAVAMRAAHPLLVPCVDEHDYDI